MKFYGHGIVWDAANNKPLCRFVDGEFETDNADVIFALADRGYKFDGELPDDEDEEEEDDDEDEEDEDEDDDAAPPPAPVAPPAPEPAPDLTDRKEIYKLLEAKGIAFHKNAPTTSLLKLLGGAEK